MKKGFTLVELMSVIIIIAIISTIAFLSINYSIERTKERLYLEQVDRLESTLKSYSTDNIDWLPIDKEGISFFSMDRLVAEGIINSADVLDPRTNEKMNGCIVVTYDDNYSQYNFTYIEQACDSASNDYMPTIIVEGGDYHTVEVNESFVIPEVESFDYLGNALPVIGPVITNTDGESLSSIDTDILSPQSQSYDYVLTYRTVDTNLNLEHEKNVELKVVDTTRPIIEVLGSTRRSSMVFEAHPVFSYPEATATDNSCGLNGTDTSVNNCDETLNVSVSSNVVSPKIPGHYVITYTTSDYYGNLRTLQVDLEIEDTTPPTIPTFELRINDENGDVYNGEWTNQNVWLGSLDSEDLGTGVQQYEYTLDCGSSNPTWVEIATPEIGETFTNTQDSSLCVRAIDGAGNISEPSDPRDIKIDKVNPDCESIGGSNQWFNTNRTITGTCSDNDSGCVEPLVVSETYTTNTNGYYSPGQVCDAAGNCTQCEEQRVRIDKTTPTISCLPTSQDWTNSNISVSVTITDTNSGIDTARSRASSNNGSTWGSWTSRTGSFNQTFSTNGIHRINVEATDRAGNQTTINCGSYEIDKTAPTASFSPNGQSSWTNSNVSVTISASDTGGSGYRRMQTRTSTNNGSSYGSWSSWTTSSSKSINLSVTGEHRIQVNVQDYAGNSSVITSNVYNIDQTTPTAPSISGGSALWTNESRTITISDGTPGPSGIDRYQYRLRNNGSTSWGSWTNYSSPITFTTEMNREIQARIIDNAGNIGTNSTISYVRIDKTNPTVNADMTGIWVRQWNDNTGKEWSPTITTPDCEPDGLMCTASVLICQRTSNFMVYGYAVNIEDDLSGVSFFLTPASINSDATYWEDNTGNPSESGSCLISQDENPCIWWRYHRSVNDRAGNPSPVFLLKIHLDYASDYNDPVVCAEK